MAMEKSYVVKETHTRSVTALGYNPARREILMGCEGILKICLTLAPRLVQSAAKLSLHWLVATYQAQCI